MKRGRCIAMNRRYRFNKFCKKGKKGNVCRIIRSCRRGQAKDRMERRNCRRIYKRWRVSWMRYQRSRRIIRRSYKWRTTRRIRKVVRRRKNVRWKIIKRRRMMRLRVLRRRKMIRRRRLLRRRLIRRRRMIRRRLMKQKRAARLRLLRIQRAARRRKLMMRRRNKKRIMRKFKWRGRGGRRW